MVADLPSGAEISLSPARRKRLTLLATREAHCLGDLLIRCAHGDDDLHPALARRALALWKELDPGLVAEAGVVWLARRADGWEATSERVLASAQDGAHA